ncbi:MAG: rhodanese-like domain-containing protein [Pseudomonadota bacterium]
MRLIFIVFLLSFALPAWAIELMSAPDARKAVQAGEIILVDIRTPEEWRETGIADVAMPITMHNNQFLSRLQTAIDENPGKKIAFICAVGGRTEYVTRELKKRGYSNLIDVSEGMLGSANGEGWIKRGLPIKQIAP